MDWVRRGFSSICRIFTRRKENDRKKREKGKKGKKIRACYTSSFGPVEIISAYPHRHYTRNLVPLGSWS